MYFFLKIMMAVLIILFTLKNIKKIKAANLEGINKFTAKFL